MRPTQPWSLAGTMCCHGMTLLKLFRDEYRFQAISSPVLSTNSYCPINSLASTNHSVVFEHILLCIFKMEDVILWDAWMAPM